MTDLNALIDELDVPEYTPERFRADRARLLTALAAKHKIAESDVDALIAEHRYTHSVEDLEDEYIQIMESARYMGWA